MQILFRFFKLEEFENAFLKCGNHCPLCKSVVDEYMNKDLNDLNNNNEDM